MKDNSRVWGSYFTNVNGRLASIALNLNLHEEAPNAGKPMLLWVWVYFHSPRPDGLSDRVEFEALASIEDTLAKHLGASCDAIEAGRITTDGHREFYFYGSRDDAFDAATRTVFASFSHYKFESGTQNDGEWNQYRHVLYPSEEDFQKMQNQDVLGVLMQHGDTLNAERDVRHWIYFSKPEARQWFASKATELGYKTEAESSHDDDRHPFGLEISKKQSVTPSQIDAAVVQLFRLAKQVDAEYDGWEAEVVAVQ